MIEKKCYSKFVNFTSNFFLLFIYLILFANILNAQDQQNSKLSFHGFLTQSWAYGWENQYFGIPKDGDTFGLRKAALQIRYEITSNDIFVIQLSHESWGKSYIGELHDSVELDWTFYEHRFENGFWTKLGKITIPFGIFNEVRDVGTLLPFYRLPYTIYGEGIYSIETINGISAGKSFETGNWTFDITGYYGESKQIQEEYSYIELKNFIGAQIWITTPIKSLRIGAAIWHADATNSLFSSEAPNYEEDWTVPLLSVDINYNWLRLIAEFVRYNYDDHISPEPYPALCIIAMIKATDKLTINAMYEYATYERKGSDPYKWDPWDESSAIGFAYAFKSNVVLHTEFRTYKGFTIERDEIDYEGPAYKAKNFLTSLSVSF